MLYLLGRPRQIMSLLFLIAWTVLGWTACVTPGGTNASRQGLIWEAQKADQIITLVGTMHVGVSPDEIPKALWARLDQADTVVTEVDLAGMNSALIKRYLLLPEQQNLEQLLGAADWQRYRQIIGEAFPSNSQAQLQKMTALSACSKLMMAEALLAQKSSKANQDQASDGGDQISIDQYIAEQAKEQQKTFHTFESLAEQFTLLEQVFTIEQLREMLEDSAENRSYYQKLSSSFKQGDLATIDAMVATMPVIQREVLLDQRNQNWGKKLDQLLSKQKTFIAIGAAHLGGPQGLLNILEAKGFRLKALRL
jgi:uncharacterized protein YbaP (TraB family)